MSNHLTNNQIEAYGCRTLSAAELLSVSDHLGVCEICRLQVEKALVGDATFFALKSEVFGEVAETHSPSVERTHLTFERMAEYVDETLAGEEQQVVKDHLTSCEQCVIAVKDLRAFKNQVASELNCEYLPSTIRATTGSPRRRFDVALRSLLPGFPAVMFGSALMVFLLAMIGWLIWQALQSKDTKPKIVVTTPSPNITPSISPTPTLGGSATVIVQLNDAGGQVTLDQGGNISGVDNLTPAHRQLIKEALTDQQLEKSPLLAGLTRPRSSLMGGSDQDGKFSVVEPVGKVMLSDRPTFRWSRLNGATSYVVGVYDENFGLLTTSPQLTGTSWTPPQSLKRGEIYSWQVKASKDGQELISPRPPAPQAKFRILDQAKANELAQARASFGSSHLALGVLYAHAGLLDEAERELRALQKINPNSTVVPQLLASVQAMRR